MITRHDDLGSRSMLREPPESATLWLVFGKTAMASARRATMNVSDTLPDDIDALRALIAAERAAHAAVVAERDKLAARNERLEAIIAEIRRAHFGRKSERITDDQLSLALEELETALAKAETEDEKADPGTQDRAHEKAPCQPQREPRSSAPRRGGDRAGEQGVPVLRRRAARHRRGHVEAAGQGSGPGPRDRHASAEVSRAGRARRRVPMRSPASSRRRRRRG